jgi:hypothetical protein
MDTNYGKHIIKAMSKEKRCTTQASGLHKNSTNNRELFSNGLTGSNTRDALRV